MTKLWGSKQCPGIPWKTSLSCSCACGKCLIVDEEQEGCWRWWLFRKTLRPLLTQNKVCGFVHKQSLLNILYSFHISRNYRGTSRWSTSGEICLPMRVDMPSISLCHLINTCTSVWDCHFFVASAHWSYVCTLCIKDQAKCTTCMHLWALIYGSFCLFYVIGFITNYGAGNPVVSRARKTNDLLFFKWVSYL